MRLFFSSHHGVSGIHCICSKQMVNTFLSSGRNPGLCSFSDGHRVHEQQGRVNPNDQEHFC